MALHVISGCMFAGKTKALLAAYRERRAAGAACLLVAHKLDSRYGSGAVRTHDGDSVPAIVASNLVMLDLTGYSDVFVDEGSFFGDLLVFADRCVAAGINLTVCGLDLTYDLQPFGHIIALAARPGARHTQPRGLCACGAEAIYTRRRSDIHAGTVLVGGSDIYAATCLQCHEDVIDVAVVQESDMYHGTLIGQLISARAV